MNNQSIHRHVVPVDDETHSVFLGEVVYVNTRSPEVVEIWASDQDPQWRSFCVSGTGHHVPGDWQHRGSAIAANGSLVWHLWEIP